MKTCVKIVVLLLLTALLAPSAFAQRPAAGGSDQFARFREQNKYTFELMQMIRHIGRIDRDPKQALKQAQAKKILAVLKPLRSKPTLTQDQAKQAVKQLNSVLTADQIKAMARAQTLRRSGDGPTVGKPPKVSGKKSNERPRPDGKPGSPGLRRPGAFTMNPAAMKSFNPLYVKVSKSDPSSAMRAKMWDDYFSRLDAKARGVKTAPAKVPSKTVKGKK